MKHTIASFNMALLASAFLFATTPLQATESKVLSNQEAIQIANDAYDYGYSLITSDVTRVQFTNVEKAAGMKAPANSFVNVPRYPPAAYRGVSAPNADTLYSVAWVDLTEPKVFSHPEIANRYFLFELVDLWMHVIPGPGIRTTGPQAANYLLTGPNWQGTVPADMVQVRSPTRYMLILGRTYANGSEADYKAVNALQAQFKLTPLSAWGKPYQFMAPAIDPNPGFSLTERPQSVILAMSAEDYFNRMARLMARDNPPTPSDWLMLARMEKIGLVPGAPFAASKLSAAVQAALNEIPAQALKRMGAHYTNSSKPVNGWTSFAGTGVYGSDYLTRAGVAAFGYPGQLPQDALYPKTEVDAEGKSLNGANRYTATFPKGQLPPAKAFWSVTMYEVDKGHWFYANALKRHTLSPRDKLTFNADGSLTMYFQHDSPGVARESNWLPAPAGDFALVVRIYSPEEAASKGEWMPPPVQRQK